MSEFILIAFAVLVFVGFAAWKKQKAKRPTKAATPWIVSQGAGVPAAPTLLGDGWTIDIPSAPGYLAYVTWLDEPRLTLGGALHLSYEVTGGPMLATELPESAADCGVMIQRRGDNLSARGKYAGYRWFNRQHLPLTPGIHMATLVLDESEWGPVMADPQGASFLDCLREADSISIVFGGAGGRGHGVYAVEPARFTLLDLSLSVLP